MSDMLDPREDIEDLLQQASEIIEQLKASLSCKSMAIPDDEFEQLTSEALGIIAALTDRTVAEEREEIDNLGRKRRGCMQ
jgi:hypothetical protein